MKKFIGKLIKKIILLLIILIILAVAAALVLIDPLLKTGIQKGGTYALDVDTKVNNVDLQLTSGRLIIEGLNIANPQDFDTPHFMDMSRFDVQLTPSSLLTDQINITNFELNGLDLNIEQKLTGSNVKTILNNLKRFETTPSKPKKTAGAKKVLVDKVVIKDVVAHFTLLSDIPAGKDITVKVPEIVLNNVASDDAGGVVLEELISRIIPAILAAVIEKSEGIVPADFLKDIDSQVQDLAEALGSSAEAIVKQGAEDLKGAVDETIKEAGSLFKDVLGNKKETPKE